MLENDNSTQKMKKDSKIDYFQELVKFDKKYDDEAYAASFWIVDDEDDFFEYWSDLKDKNRKEFSNIMKIFASADGTGSRYAFWMRDKDSNYNNAPIICYGSEGEMYVVAEDIKALLKMLSFGSEILHEGAFYHDVDSDDVLDDEGSCYQELISDYPNFEIFRSWMKNKLKIEPVSVDCLKKSKCSESQEIRKLHKQASKKYKKEFDLLIDKYFPYIKDWKEKKLKEYQGKKSELLKLLAKNPTVDIYTALAKNEEILDDVDYEQKNKYYLKSLELEPNNIEILKTLASFNTFRDPEKSLKYYLQLSEINKNPKEYYGDIAFAYDHIGKYKLAIEYYKKAIIAGQNGYRGSYQGYFLEICEKLKSEECVNILEDTLKKNRDFYTYKALYEYYFKYKNYNKSLENLLNYLEYSDENINTFIKIGKKLFKKGFYKETVAIFEKLLSQGKGLKNNKLLLLNYIAVCYIEMEPNMLDKAYITLKKAYEYDNSQELIWNNLKVCAHKFFNEKDYEKALEVYEFCINEIGMIEITIYNKIGKIYEKLENLSKALEYYDKAKEV